VLDCFENIDKIWTPLMMRYFFIGLWRRSMFHGVRWYSV